MDKLPLNNWSTLSASLNKGDVITLPGQYKRRTFWQWLKREPRQIQQFVITETCGGMSEYEPTR